MSSSGNKEKNTNGVQRRASGVRGGEENWVCSLLKRERSRLKGKGRLIQFLVFKKL